MIDSEERVITLTSLALRDPSLQKGVVVETFKTGSSLSRKDAISIPENLVERAQSALAFDWLARLAQLFTHSSSPSPNTFKSHSKSEFQALLLGSGHKSTGKRLQSPIMAPRESRKSQQAAESESEEESQPVSSEQAAANVMKTAAELIAHVLTRSLENR